MSAIAPPGHVTEPMVAAFYTPPDKLTPELKAAVAQSDGLVAELFAHDVILVSAPMYNFGIPSTLKAYIDNIVRVGLTFNFDQTQPNPYVPLVHGKKLFVVTSRGGAGYGPGGPMAALNFTDTYLTTIFGFIGVTDAKVVGFDYANADDATKAKGLAAAEAEIATLVGA